MVKIKLDVSETYLLWAKFNNGEVLRNNIKIFIENGILDQPGGSACLYTFINRLLIFANRFDNYIQNIVKRNQPMGRQIKYTIDFINSELVVEEDPERPLDAEKFGLRYLGFGPEIEAIVVKVINENRKDNFNLWEEAKEIFDAKTIEEYSFYRSAID